MVDLTTDQVWKIVTNPNNFDALYIPGLISARFALFDEQTVNPGYEFSPIGNSEKRLYIVEWKKPYIFSFGYQPNDWTFRFKLRGIASATEVTFEREFRKTPWFEEALGKITGNSIEIQELADESISRLEKLCDEGRREK